MGGYGVYVWGSYAVTFILLTIEVLMVIRRRRAASLTANSREKQLEPESSDLETGFSHSHRASAR